MGHAARALLLMIIIYYKAGMNHAGNPTEKRQEDA